MVREGSPFPDRAEGPRAGDPRLCPGSGWALDRGRSGHHVSRLTGPARRRHLLNRSWSAGTGACAGAARDRRQRHQAPHPRIDTQFETSPGLISIPVGPEAADVAVNPEERRTQMLKTIFASVSAAAATVFLSVGAAAGATPQHFNLSMPYECFSKADYSICVVAKGEETIVQTPSGNFSGDVSMTSSYAVSYQGALVATGADSFHE